MRYRSRLAVLGAAALLSAGCDPCFGTPSCNVPPQISYGGQFIVHRTGQAVPGVQVAFVRQTGIHLASDSVVAVSASDGFFQLRVGAFWSGEVKGALIVTPPAPFKSYRIDSLTLSTQTVRGEGVFAGRLVVDPYLLFVGEVRDRWTKSLVTGATVSFRRTGGILVTPDTITLVSDKDGRAFFELFSDVVGSVEGEATITATGYPRPYRFPLHVKTKYVEEPEFGLVPLPLGQALQYVAEVLRRGTRTFVPNVEVEFKRTGGILTDPQQFTFVVPENGIVPLMPRPLADGDVIADITIRPPAPFRTEVLRDIRLTATDGDSLKLLGHLGFGAQIYLRSTLRYRINGEFVEQAAQGRARRISGLSIFPDTAITQMKANGVFEYSAAAPDTGRVTVDLEIRLRAPFDYDTIHGVVIPARLDSVATDIGTLRVGRWFPWYGEVRDAQTDAPIANAQVRFRRTAGIGILPSPYSAVTGADGRFILRPLPLAGGEVIGDLTIAAGSSFRDTTVTGVRIQTSKDDTERLLSVYRVQRIP